MSDLRAVRVSEVSTTLPPEERSPGLARRHVRQALLAAGLEHLLDDALLMVTELVTNAVVHAGTDVDLELDTTAPGLRVEVVDRGRASVPALRGDAAEERESGRGLFLLDALATRWGTTHTASGKSVWFELERPAPARAAARAPAAAVRSAPAPLDGDLARLLALPADLEARLPTPHVLSELVHRLADALGVQDAHLLVEDAGADGWSPVAVRGRAPDAAGVLAARRLLGGGDPVVRAGGDLLLGLRSRGDAFGALVLSGAGGLDPTRAAVARLVAERLAVLVRDEHEERARAREQGSLALLAEASEMFASTLDVQLAVTLAAQLVVPRFARWAAVHTLSDRDVRLDALAHATEDHVPALRAALDSAGGRAFAADLAEALAGQRPVLVPAGSVPAELSQHAPGQLLVLPLVARRRLLGGLLVAQDAGGAFAPADVDVLLDLARRAALTVDNARLYEERTGIARALQASLLPPELPAPPHLDLGARYVAAGEGNEVGGDFYDVFALPEGRWAVAIGDVCGKGAEAAAITGLARNVLRVLLRQGRSPSQTLRELNAAILDLGERGRFCTCAVAVLEADGDGGGVAVRYAVAGHPPPAVVGNGAPPRLVGRGGTVLGVLEDVDLADDELHLAPGESLVLYTDGVTERRRGRVMFGEETLLEVLGNADGGSADALAGALEQAVRSFGRDVPRDDLAVLVARATGGA